MPSENRTLATPTEPPASAKMARAGSRQARARPVLFVGGGQAGLLGPPPVVEVAADGEEPGQAAGQVPGELVQATASGLVHRRHQARPLGLEPGQRLGVHQAADGPAGWPPQGATMGQTQRAGLDDGCGLAGQEQPATEPPHQGGRPLGWIVVAQGAFAGVDPEQVIEAVADLANLVDPAGLQQLRVDQRVNQVLTSRRIEVENGRGHPGREVERLQQAQPPERPLLPVGEGAVAEGDAGPDL